MFASAPTYKSCECQLAAARREALPTPKKKKQTFVFFSSCDFRSARIKETRKTKAPGAEGGGVGEGGRVFRGGGACYICMASLADTCDLFVVPRHCQQLF